MRYIIVPAPVQLRDPIDDSLVLKSEKDPTPDEPWDLHRVVQTLAFRDPNWPKGLKGAQAARRIRRAIRTSAGIDTYVALETSDWEVLKKVIEDPQNPWNTSISEQLVDFLEAIVDAKDTKPKAPEAD